MAASTWGGSTIKIVAGSLRPNIVPDTIVEIPLSPDPANITAICSDLQQQGRKRMQQKVKLYFATMAEYNALATDAIAGTVKTLADSVSGLDASYVIWSLGEPELQQDNAIWADVTFLEATE